MVLAVLVNDRRIAWQTKRRNQRRSHGHRARAAEVGVIRERRGRRRRPIRTRRLCDAPKGQRGDVVGAGVIQVGLGAARDAQGAAVAQRAGVITLQRAGADGRGPGVAVADGKGQSGVSLS